MNASINNPVTKSTSIKLRAVDTIDRAHARAAMVLHNARNDLRATVERSIDRVEQLAMTAIERARDGVQRVDHKSADLVNRAQGVVGSAIEKVRAKQLAS